VGRRTEKPKKHNALTGREEGQEKVVKHSNTEGRRQSESKKARLLKAKET
jgi:hypothetical protein